mgnify:CR=1 FL=1
MRVSMDKQYRTRDGRPVRVLATDASGEYPVVVLIGAGRRVATLTACGSYYVNGPTNPSDIVEVLPVCENVQSICNGLGSLSPVKFTWAGDKLLGAVQQG